jgi:site-specific DNA recombinase
MRRKQPVESIVEGVPGSEVKDELIAIAARREELQQQHAAISEPKPLLHSEMAAIYCAKVTELARALQEPDSRSEAIEVRAAIVSHETVIRRHACLTPGGPGTYWI